MDNQDKPPRILKTASGIGLVLAFSLCAAYDFWRGYQTDRSLMGGIVFVVFGIPFTVVLWYLISKKSDK